MKYFSTSETRGVKKLTVVRDEGGAGRIKSRLSAIGYRQEIKEMNIERRIQSQGGFKDSRDS